MDLAVQIHSEGRKRAGRSLALFSCFQDHGRPGSQTGRHPLRRFPLHLCGRAIGGRWRGPPSHARLVRSNRDSHRLRPRGGLLLCGWYSSLHLDGCCPILRDDRRLNHPLLCRRLRSWWAFGAAQLAQGHRSRHGQSVPFRPHLRSDVMDRCLLPRRPRRGRPTSSGFASDDAQRRQGPQTSGHLVLRLANTLHCAHVHYRAGLPCNFPRP